MVRAGWSALYVACRKRLRTSRQAAPRHWEPDAQIGHRYGGLAVFRSGRPRAPSLHVTSWKVRLEGRRCGRGIAEAVHEGLGRTCFRRAVFRWVRRRRSVVSIREARRRPLPPCSHLLAPAAGGVDRNGGVFMYETSL